MVSAISILLALSSFVFALKVSDMAIDDFNGLYLGGLVAGPIGMGAGVAAAAASSVALQNQENKTPHITFQGAGTGAALLGQTAALVAAPEVVVPSALVGAALGAGGAYSLKSHNSTRERLRNAAVGANVALATAMISSPGKKILQSAGQHASALRAGKYMAAGAAAALVIPEVYHQIKKQISGTQIPLKQQSVAPSDAGKGQKIVAPNAVVLPDTSA